MSYRRVVIHLPTERLIQEIPVTENNGNLTEDSMKNIWNKVVAKTRNYHTGHHVEADPINIPLKSYRKLTDFEKGVVRLLFCRGKSVTVRFWVVAK